MYHFFYDEAEHSRIINYTTIMAANYYDNFCTAIIGWSEEKEDSVRERYEEFESKYADRMKNGEIKSGTIKQDAILYGFASLRKQNLDFVEDYLKIISDESVITYFSVFSKIEYVILQLFRDYKNENIVDADSMKYSIIKLLNVYRPRNVLEAIYNQPEKLVEALKDFAKERIALNQKNEQLKVRENSALRSLLIILEGIEPIQTINWCYVPPFDGFNRMLCEMNVEDYSLVIDAEGRQSNTLLAANQAGLSNVSDGDSKLFFGIRMADILIGIIAKLMKSIRNGLHLEDANIKVEKSLLDQKWFEVNDRQLNLYKLMHKVLCVNSNYWYKSFSGLYPDDLVLLISLLDFMAHYDSVAQIKASGLERQSEYYNAVSCDELQQYFKRLQKGGTPITTVEKNDNDFFYGNKGEKIYWDQDKQPKFEVSQSPKRCLVLSVGINSRFEPIMSVQEEAETKCYRLPMDYQEWASRNVYLAHMGANIFPIEVEFRMDDGQYIAEIL